ncbi:MAG: hypothetical protein KIT19_05370 [Phycisphaeraceae bacterium]|nr:hypothetical protein [Phycisphaeraceae bacterium]
MIGVTVAVATVGAGIAWQRAMRLSSRNDPVGTAIRAAREPFSRVRMIRPIDAEGIRLALADASVTRGDGLDGAEVSEVLGTLRSTIGDLLFHRLAEQGPLAYLQWTESRGERLLTKEEWQQVYKQNLDIVCKARGVDAGGMSMREAFVALWEKDRDSGQRGIRAIAGEGNGVHIHLARVRNPSHFGGACVGSLGEHWYGGIGWRCHVWHAPEVRVDELARRETGVLMAEVCILADHASGERSPITMKLFLNEHSGLWHLLYVGVTNQRPRDGVTEPFVEF